MLNLNIFSLIRHVLKVKCFLAFNLFMITPYLFLLWNLYVYPIEFGLHVGDSKFGVNLVWALAISQLFFFFTKQCLQCYE